MTTRQRVLFVVNLTAAVALAGLTLTAVTLGLYARMLIAAIGVVIAYAVIRTLVHFERERAAAWAISLSYAALILGMSTFDHGVRSAAAPSYLIVIAIAALLLSARGALIFALLGVATFTALEAAGAHGLLPAALPSPEHGYVVALVIDCGIAGALAGLAARHTAKALRDAGRSAAEAQAGRRELEARARDQATLAELGRLALTRAPIGALMQQVATDLTKALDVDFVDVIEVDAPQRRARLLASTASAPLAATGEAFTLQEGALVLRAQAADAPVQIRDLEDDPTIVAPRLRAAGVRASLCVRLAYGETSIGIVAAHSRAPREFDEHQRRFLQAVASVVSAAIARLRAEDALAGAEAHLRQTAKMEAIGRLAGGVAHDFNNLMTVVLAYSDLLGAEPLSAQQQADVAQVRHAAERATALTRQLLAFSRRQVLHPVVVDPSAAITSLTKLLTRVLGEDIELVTVLDPTADGVLVDPVQLEQMILNLAVNAREAMPNGGRIIIATSLVTHPGGDDLAAGTYIEISVTDTGTGIAPETLPHLFEPFFTTKSEGTGLGLATVYGIIKQSGGEVKAEAPPEGGARFRLLLPHARRASPPAAAERAASTEAPPGRRVLVVDDERTVLAVAVRLLQAAGHHVVGVTTPAEALHACTAEPFDLVLSDVVMPEMSGPELMERMIQAGCSARFLLMSGYVGDALDRRVPVSAHAALLGKPFTAATLHEAVARVLATPLAV
ncbi:MAG: response regulator [Deltaproteobacteria bacterium]|nr:response regulator [Deltaproteobacteria bacterium]